MVFQVSLTTNGQFEIGIWNKTVPGYWRTTTTANAPVQSNKWQLLTVTLADASDTNGLLRLYLDDYVWQATNFCRLNSDKADQAVIAAMSGRPPGSASGPPVTNFFRGKIGGVRLWNAAFTADGIRSNRYELWPETAPNLIGGFKFNEGQGLIAHSETGETDGTLCGAPVWCWGQIVPDGSLPEFPGYIHTAEGNRYNVDYYNYPAEAAPDAASYVFAVNTGQLEVWWANRSRQTGLPPVYYPSRAARYNNVWPWDAPQIVIASGLGSDGDQLQPTNDALRFDGGDSVSVPQPLPALLNLSGELTVEAWVKLDHLTNDQKIVSWASSTPAFAGFVLGADNGEIFPEIWNTDGTYYSVQAGSIPNNTWTHLAFTFKAGDALIAYVNGREVARTAVGSAPLKIAASDLVLGRASWQNGYNLAGAIGEVRLWNIARSRAEIQGSKFAELAGDEAGLLACYPFARGPDSAVLADVGPNKMDGAIAGATWTGSGRPAPVASAFLAGAPAIYFQNDPSRPGYNPNEEHALLLGGVAYALRNDLNTASSSVPFVLVDGLNPETARPEMTVFSVVATNLEYSFERDLNAGLPILPPMPLGAMPLGARNYSDTKPPAWQDRKLEWWAVAAGDDGGGADAIMHFYYQMQPSFYFPALAASNQPALGTELPWLPNPFQNYGTNGPPVAVIYHLSWPDNLPELQLGQTLTTAARGLPDIWDQLSVQTVYQQSAQLGQGDSVTLFDPVADQEVDLDRAVIDAMLQSQLARQDVADSLIRFPKLPPSLYPRLFFDPTRGPHGRLVLEGQLVSTLTGSGYLLLNALEDFEKAQARETAGGIDAALKGKWDAAIESLPGGLALILPNTPYVRAALGARLTNGVGYVTLAFNNSTNDQQVPPASPVSLSLLKVVPELYSGELEVIQPEDALAEQLSLRYSADLAGQVSQCEFQWHWAEPSGGLIPNTNFPGWNVYGADPSPGTNEVTIRGASPFTLSDHFFAVRYRPLNTAGPSGTNWSQWTYNLAPGWVKRAMTGINPFAQTFQDKIANSVDPRVTMISMAGGPYEGDVALNLNAADNAGLIATYQTIFNRAKAFSLEAGLSDPGINQTLLFAATRLHDLYELLGDEAYADAEDPTIAFPNSLATDEYGGDATSIFPFMNQVPNLLEEELALLRGRDDTLGPGVETSPVYNRLFWNFTQGINGGEAAYAYNYNILGTPTSTAGAITAEDAKRLYPQGHGDAWGHYLSAITPYYDLLAYTNFGWQTRPEATLLGNASLTTDYRDEQKFAETAAARARTGAEIVNRVFRERYSEDPAGRWAGYHDSDTNRAWGLAGWASRAGQAAYYDWVVANSLMLDHLTNMVQVGGDDRPPEGVEQIDRASMPELAEIAASFHDIQSQLDSADGGLNPLGLARNVVPFDIDPAEIDAGKTPFEQIYDRALQALYNACTAFDHARNATLQLRHQSDSAYDLAAALAQNEIDYHNRLIELYGYPYPDDIGPGKTYPQGYAGPDLIDWQILDLENLIADAPTGQVVQVQVANLDFVSSQNWTDDYKDYKNPPTSSSNYVGTISVCLADNGLKVKPSGWTSHRPAQGELQQALSDYVETWYSLQAKAADYNQTLAKLETDMEHTKASYDRYTTEWEREEELDDYKKAAAKALAGLKTASTAADLAAEATRAGLSAAGAYVPGSIYGAEGPFPVLATFVDPDRFISGWATFAKWAQKIVNLGFEASINGVEANQSVEEADFEQLLGADNYRGLLRWGAADMLVELKEQYVKQAELFAQVAALSQSQQRVGKLLAEGQRLITERAQVRARAAQRIQSARYADLNFRIFRNDSLRRYQTAFDLAARYTYLAAKAYDYETGLLDSDNTHTPGSKFLADVVRARAPGRFNAWLGAPMVGGASGEPGLADILARMKADWGVVKGRYGFNNPDTETSRFSLRSELWRISPSSSGDATWAQALENCMVANLHELPEFVRYCRPFDDNTNVEPALVIPFSTFVVAGKNYFGNDLAGGDNAYDASHAATKIRSVGVWFTGYNVTFNTNSSGAGLADEPRVYLLPIGQDVMRSPTRNAVATRSWTVFDQAIPLPYNVGGADVDNPDWIPIKDSLQEPLAQIRRYASFRAYHDSGQFVEAETHNHGRLVGRSVWNTRWLLIIPGRALLADPEEGVERFIHGASVNGERDGRGIKDIKLFFQTYSISGD